MARGAATRSGQAAAGATGTTAGATGTTAGATGTTAGATGTTAGGTGTTAGGTGTTAGGTGTTAGATGTTAGATGTTADSGKDGETATKRSHRSRKRASNSPPAAATKRAAILEPSKGPRIARRIWTPLEGDSLALTGTVDQRIAALASAQHGRVSRRQLLLAVVTPKQIRGRLAGGRLIGVSPGVYAASHLAPQPLANETAALLGAPPGTVLSHLTAARLWQLHGHREPPGPIHLLMSSASGQRRAGAVIHRTTVPVRARPAYVRGLPVTQVEQTLIDIGALVSARELERALDEALARGLTSRSVLARALHEAGNQRGCATLRALVRERGPLSITRSVAEERFLALIRDAGLPPPHTNTRLCGFNVDFYWPQALLVVEIDGYQWHSSRSAFERDRRKELALRQAGLELMRITWEQMSGSALATVARVTAVITARTSALPARAG